MKRFLLILLLCTSMLRGGVLFNADNENIDCGNSAAINNLAAGTVCLWVYFNAIGADYILLDKMTAWPGTNDFLLWQTTSDEILVTVGRATTVCKAESNTSPISTGKWIFIAARWDTAGAAGDQEIFIGDATTMATEVGGYASQQLGTGARTSGTADLGIGGHAAGSPAWMYQDHIIAVVGIFNTNISEAAMRDFQRRPRKMANCVGLWFPGLHGATTVPDMSGQGNHGTINNATLDANPPIPAPFGRD